MKIFAIISLWVLVFFKRLALVLPRLRTWLGDHFQWFRKLSGGTWYNWNGFWQKIEVDGTIYFKRGLKGFDLSEGLEASWDFKQILNKGDSIIQAIEDYTKKEIKKT